MNWFKLRLRTMLLLTTVLLIVNGVFMYLALSGTQTGIQDLDRISAQWPLPQYRDPPFPATANVH